MKVLWFERERERGSGLRGERDGEKRMKDGGKWWNSTKGMVKRSIPGRPNLKANS